MKVIYLLVIFSNFETGPVAPIEFSTFEQCQAAGERLQNAADREGYVRRTIVTSCVAKAVP